MRKQPRCPLTARVMLAAVRGRELVKQGLLVFGVFV